MKWSGKQGWEIPSGDGLGQFEVGRKGGIRTRELVRVGVSAATLTERKKIKRPHFSEFKRSYSPSVRFGAIAAFVEGISCLSSHHTRNPIPHRTSHALLPFASDPIECRCQEPNPLPCSRDHTTRIPNQRTISSSLALRLRRGHFLRSLSRQRLRHHLRDLRLHPRSWSRRM